MLGGFGLIAQVYQKKKSARPEGWRQDNLQGAEEYNYHHELNVNCKIILSFTKVIFTRFQFPTWRNLAAPNPYSNLCRPLCLLHRLSSQNHAGTLFEGPTTCQPSWRCCVSSKLDERQPWHVALLHLACDYVGCSTCAAKNSCLSTLAWKPAICASWKPAICAFVRICLKMVAEHRRMLSSFSKER